jgi:hypothetical protein
MRQITFLQSSLDPACAECDDKLAEVAALTSTLDMVASTRLASSEPAPVRIVNGVY